MEVEDVDSSNDVVPIETHGEDSGDQPIMGLIKRLIGNDSKQNTILTNFQIIHILKTEFNINTNELQELEVDIYLSVMKKFLKHWPQWDEFDRVIKELKSNGDNEGIQKLLEVKYTNLKNYLCAMLDVAKPIAKEAVTGLIQKKKNNDVIMEVHCSRSQLNELIYRKPPPHLNYTILNITDTVPSKINLGILPLKTIVNWWFVEVHFSFKNLIFIRRTKHNLNHLLVNTRLGNPKIDGTSHDMNFYQKNQKVSFSSQVPKQQLVDMVYQINKLTAEPPMKEILNTILNIFVKDIELAPDVLTVPAIYKRKLNKYSYIRYLYTDVDCNNQDEQTDKYDLRLQETITPEFELSLRKVDTEMRTQKTVLNSTVNIQVECKLCMLRFSGNGMEVNLTNHFTSFHMYEPNWSCVNCKEEFSMPDLCENWWYHTCKR